MIQYYTIGRGDLAPRSISFNIRNRSSEICFFDFLHDIHTPHGISMHTVSETLWYALHGIDLLALVAVTGHNVNVAVFLDNKVE